MEKKKTSVSLIDSIMFPLHSRSSLAARWGVSSTVVSNWEKRHADFPKRVNLFVENLAIFYNGDVEAYEAARGGLAEVAKTNAAKGNR